jgi:phosphinothricin acetyltransferase
MDEPRIRVADEPDLPAIDDIYNHYVTTSTCTYQYEPTTPDERRAWFADHAPALHPVTVAELDGAIVGWGALSRFHGRSGYRFTVENTVYVRHDQQRRGIGRALLDDLVARARAIGHRTVIASIDADQPASIKLHGAAGFVEVARLRQVGFKFERWLDVVYLQKML